MPNSRRISRSSAGLTVGELLLILLVAGVAVGGTVLAFLGFSSRQLSSRRLRRLRRRKNSPSPDFHQLRPLLPIGHATLQVGGTHQALMAFAHSFEQELLALGISSAKTSSSSSSGAPAEAGDQFQFGQLEGEHQAALLARRPQPPCRLTSQ